MCYEGWGRRKKEVMSMLSNLSNHAKRPGKCTIEYLGLSNLVEHAEQAALRESSGKWNPGAPGCATGDRRTTNECNFKIMVILGILSALAAQALGTRHETKGPGNGKRGTGNGKREIEVRWKMLRTFGRAVGECGRMRQGDYFMCAHTRRGSLEPEVWDGQGGTEY